MTTTESRIDALRREPSAATTDDIAFLIARYEEAEARARRAEFHLEALEASRQGEHSPTIARWLSHNGPFLGLPCGPLWDWCQNGEGDAPPPEVIDAQREFSSRD